uniref:Protein kinase domain-containing protein n=1 Tax=viral metagenome TaxID=1070528 RepID=A0A6C0BUC7_9ZZZZ
MKEIKYIQYHKWDKKIVKNYFNSLKNVLEIKSPQFYIPFFSLYFYIHNTKNSHKLIDLKRQYYLTEIKDIIKEKYYNSNMILDGVIYDSSKNTYINETIFCKTIPVLEIIHCINNNYNLINNNNYHLPSGYNYNTFKKINDINNTAYIDVFCSFLFSKLVVNNILPNFAIFYGSTNCIGNYKYDITDEYSDLRIDKCFNQNLNNTFKLDIYVSSDEESDESDEDFSDSEESDINYNDDYIAKIKNIPLQLLFIEKLEGTLEDYLISDEFNGEVILSCLFQISFALHYLQKKYKFTHNDLHINNIMYSNTEKEYLYYKINNKYFRIPTYGKIFKIIDFGRSIITYNNKTYMNDVFSKNSEAWGQYYYPSQVDFYNKKEKNIPDTKPSFNFDLCRLSMTILDELGDRTIDNSILDLLNHMCTDKYGDNYRDMIDDFSLYINISKNSVNSLPIDILNHKIFKEYRVQKKNFPLKLYYKF